MQTYQEFYSAIEKPFFAPPEWVFGLAWGVIYPLIAIALVWLLYLAYKGRVPKMLLGIFGVNLVFNFLFTPVQLGLSVLWPASAVILLVFGTVLYFEIKIFKYSKVIFFLLLPYLLWGSFATVLQLVILFMN